LAYSIELFEKSKFGFSSPAEVFLIQPDAINILFFTNLKNDFLKRMVINI